MKNNIITIVKKLEEMLKSEYGKCEILEGRFSSGDQTYHLYKINAPEEYGALVIARDWCDGLYMAQFECADGKLDVFFGFATKQSDTIRWRYYFEDGKYVQGCLDDWFLSEQASKTMTTIHRTPESIYGMSKEDAVNEILDAYGNTVSEGIVKSAITKQTLMKGNYDMFRFWSRFDLPEPEKDEDGRRLYDNCKEYVNSLDMKTLVEMFDDIDSRFNSWCTPEYAMLVKIANA